MTVGCRPTFAPVPLRAYRDKTLTAIDLRVLAAIAVHDRFNGNDQACWASNKRLAEVGGCHVKSVPRSIGRLIKAGYLRDLSAKPGRQRSRSRFLTVIYTEADAQSMESKERPTAPSEAAETEPALPMDAPVRAPAPPPSQRGGYLEGNSQVTQREKRRYSAEAERGFRGAPGARAGPPQPLTEALREKREAERWLAERLAEQHGGDLSAGYAILAKTPNAPRWRRP